MGMSKKRFYTYCYGICASLCMFINGFDASVFNNLQGIPRFMNDMDLDQNAKEDQNLIGAVTSSYMAATIFAGLFISPFITHYLGRRASIFTGCVVVIVASLIQTFSKNIAAFIGGRIVLGLGQGIALPAGPVFMSEITPPQIRGRMLSFWQMMYSVGALVTSYSALGLERSPFLGDWQWKTITLIQAAIPLTCAICIFLCPESPRWLVQKGKEDKARRAIARVREPEEVELELQEIKAAIEWEQKYTSNSLKDLWVDKSILRRLILGMVINFGQQITGQSMMNNYSTKVYKSVFTSSSTILLINALNYTFGIIFTLTCTFLSDRMGRTTMLIIAGIGQGIMLLIAGTVYVTTPNIVADNGTVSKTTSVGAALVTAMFLFTFFYKPGWGATVWIYTSEIFPMSVRGTAVSVCTNTQNVSNLVMAQAFPPMFLAMGFYAFYVWMGVNFVLAVLVWWFYPETKGVPLEEMDKLFGGVDKTADLHHEAMDDSFKDEKAA